MGMWSYSNIYLEEVSDTLGIMFEYVFNNGINPVIFWNKFVTSNVARQIEDGNPKYLTCSAKDYLNDIYDNFVLEEDSIYKNKYYWSGWIIAQYQNKTGYSFSKINDLLPIEEVLRLYSTLHEADITKFFDIADSYLKDSSTPTNLKKARTNIGLSQSELSKLSNVELRSIQMYEQRRNDINKAQGETLYKLSKVLGCRIEDLLE